MGGINRPYFSALQTASWRGMPFGTRGSTLKVGRRLTLTGRLVQDGAYGGGDVIAQRMAMIAACETEDKGDGELVHPSLGRITASLLDFECEESAEQGRVFELRFTFIQGKRGSSTVFPILAHLATLVPTKSNGGRYRGHTGWTEAN